MRALVVGGRGQSGRAITAALAADGWEVTATSSVETDGFVGVDRTLAGSLGAAVGDGVDLLVDVVAYRPADATQLVALGDRIGAAVVLSTLSVYFDGLDDWPDPLVETQPTIAPGDSGYSDRKVAIERALLDEAPFPVTVVRPGAIVGVGTRHLREWWFLKRALDRRPRLVLAEGGTSVFQPTLAVNLGELVRVAAASPGNRVVNCGELDPPTVAEIGRLVAPDVEQVLVAGEPPAPSVGDHPWLVPRPVRCDMTAALALGYRPVADYASGLEEVLEWARSVTVGRDWREVFPRLAQYPMALFDYEAEDRWLATMTSR
ncbi:MAG: sle [Acidimicrobiales bacterium]|nr:sle [Acidimicrobiales bacterium]